MEHNPPVIEFNIPGKRRRREEHSPARRVASPVTDSRLARCSTDSPLLGHREATREADTATSTLGSTSSYARLRTPGPQTSRLEKLPAELIQQIFFFSLEVNLPRSSPRLGKILARESVYRVLILAALVDTKRGHKDINPKFIAPAVYQHSSWDQKLRLQKDVLDCRWFTMERLSQCLPTLIEYVRDTYCQILPSRSGVVVTTEIYTTEAERLASKSLTGAQFARKFGVSILDVHYLPRRLLDPKSWHGSAQSGPDWRHHKPTSSPLCLLNILFYAVNRRRISWSSPIKDCGPLIDPKALFNGIRTAIRERHREAIEVLLAIADKARAFPYSATDGLPDPTVPTEFLHLATTLGEDSAGILNCLLKDRASATHKDDPILTKWATRHLTTGSDLDRQTARWILKTMECSGHYGGGAIGPG